MNKQAFLSYCQDGFTHIPVYREILADFDTPLSAYRKLADQSNSFLFESVQGGERWGRYSIIGLPANTLIEYYPGRLRLLCNGQTEEHQTTDPLSWLRGFMQNYRVASVPGLPRFTGGLVGVFGYDTVRVIEPRLAGSAPVDQLSLPDIRLMLAEDVVVFDNLSGRVFLVTLTPADASAWGTAQERLDDMTRALRAPVPEAETVEPQSIQATDFVSSIGQTAFEAGVRACKDYILAGDVMQVVVSQRLSAPYQGRALDVYRALRCFNPSPYLYYLNFADAKVAGASPEVLARVEDGAVALRPIAGTRPRGKTPEQDAQLAEDLLADTKELAEHLMLIDLARNDTGRIAETGSVKLTEQMVIERYSHVMHMVSNVTGKLRPGLDAFDVLSATFPAGTLSGAPKVRAMQIIDEFETVRRGWYGGAVGYIDWQGNMDTAITIRTALVKDNQLHVQAGAGVVHDSVPEKEWQETMNKARAVFRAVELAGQGLDNVDFADNR